MTVESITPDCFRPIITAAPSLQMEIPQIPSSYIISPESLGCLFFMQIKQDISG